MRLLLIFILFISMPVSCSWFSSNKSDQTIQEEDKSIEEKVNEQSKIDSKLNKKNSDEETDFTEIDLLGEAIRSYDGERYSISKASFQKHTEKFPGSPLTILSELKLADSLFFGEKPAESISFYREFLRVHSKHEARPYAMYQIGHAYQQSYQGQKKDQTPLKEAIKSFSDVVYEFPKTSWGRKARDGILECEAELLKNEKEVIDFYFRTGQKQAALTRINELRSKYSHLPLLNELFSSELLSNDLTEKKVSTIFVSPTLSEAPSASATNFNSSISPRITPSLSPINEITPSLSPSSLPSSSPSPSLSPNPSVTLSISPAATLSSSPPASISNIKKITTKEEPTPEASSSPLIQPTIVTNKNKTLSDLENGKETPNTKTNIGNVDNENLENLKSGVFLKSIKCQTDEEASRVYLKFRSKPLIRSSKVIKNENSYSIKVVIQEGYSTAAIPEDNDPIWVQVSGKTYKNSVEKIDIIEKVRILKDNENFGATSVATVTLTSERPRQITVLNSESQDNLIILFK